MELYLQILLGIVSIVCLGVGSSLILKGARHFLPANIPAQPRLDNTFRFLSGMFFSFGFLLIWIVFHIRSLHDIIYFVGFVIVCAGLGRLYSSVQVGSAGKYFDYVMVIEIMLGLSTILLEYFR